ncbi:Uncharacterised protein g2664 [Pycnogonum litorale]
MSRYRLVTFDVTNTLLQFRHPVGVQYSNVMKIYGIKSDPALVESAFKHHYKQQHKDYPNFGAGTSNMDAYRWWSNVVTNTIRSTAKDTTTITKKSVSDTCQHLFEHYRSCDAWLLSVGAENLLLKLSNIGICVGVISNFDYRLFDILKGLKIITYFNFVIGSYESNVYKPQPEIFRLAEQKSGLCDLKSSQIAHVGDSFTRDYLGAKQVGWNSYFYKKDVKSVDSNVDVSNTFNSFRDLELLLFR